LSIVRQWTNHDPNRPWTEADVVEAVKHAVKKAEADGHSQHEPPKSSHSRACELTDPRGALLRRARPGCRSRARRSGARRWQTGVERSRGGRTRRSTAMRSRSTPMVSHRCVVAHGQRVSPRNGTHCVGPDQRPRQPLGQNLLLQVILEVGLDQRRRRVGKVLFPICRGPHRKNDRTGFSGTGARR
jgi:hypothetical protein